MKKLIILLAVLTASSLFAQKKIDKLSFEDCQNSEVFQKIKNHTKIMEYTASDGSILTVGDTLIIGYPFATYCQG